MPLCCRAAKKKGINFQPLCTTVQCIELPWELLSGWVKMCLGRTRLLRHLSAKLQRYHKACMKCSISASKNGWHLDRCNTDTGNSLLQSVKSQLQDRGKRLLRFNKKYTSASQNYFHPTCFSEVLLMNIIFRSR